MAGLFVSQHRKINMAIKWSDYQERQRKLLLQILNGECTLSCAAAIHVEDRSCHCRCGGLNHGAIWIEHIVVELIEE